MVIVADVAIPPDIREVTKGAMTGLHQFIEAEAIPLEQDLLPILSNERKFFREDGLMVDEARRAKDQVRAKSAAAGYYAMFAPESLGGGGLGLRSMIFVVEDLNRQYGPGRPLITWAKGFITLPPLASFVDGPSMMLTTVSDPVREEFMPGIVAGQKTVCFGLSEADAGSDVWGIKTRALRDGGGWALNGSKLWITNSPYADYAVVFAVTDEEKVSRREGGISAFFIETGAAGYTFDGVLRIFGHLGSDCGSFTLEDVRVSEERVMGEIDQGFRIAMNGISEGRLAIAAHCLGLSEYALDRSLEYAAQRRTFGQSLSEHQAVQFMLADMAIDIYTMKYMLLQTAALVDSGQAAVKEVSIAKAYAVEKTQDCYDRAIQVHGGVGLTGEMPLEEGFRIARTLRIPDGTGEMQRRTIARRLLRGDTAF